MPLILAPLEPQDAFACTRVSTAAFEGPVADRLFPNGYSAADEAWFDEEVRKDIQTNGQHGVWKYINKIVDTDLPDDDPLNKIISIAIWSFTRRDRTEADFAKEEEESKALGHPPGRNEALNDAFFGQMSRQRRERFGGKPHAVLKTLCTLPQHHRRGAGAIHLKWGIAKADEDNLPLWLEATPDGQPLYERYGWKAVGKLDFDPVAHGLPAFDTVNMLRDPQQTKTTT